MVTTTPASTSMIALQITSKLVLSTRTISSGANSATRLIDHQFNTEWKHVSANLQHLLTSSCSPSNPGHLNEAIRPQRKETYEQCAVPFHILLRQDLLKWRASRQRNQWLPVRNIQDAEHVTSTTEAWKQLSEEKTHLRALCNDHSPRIFIEKRSLLQSHKTSIW